MNGTREARLEAGANVTLRGHVGVWAPGTVLVVVRFERDRRRCHVMRPGRPADVRVADVGQLEAR